MAPFVDHSLLGKPPKGAHLAVMVDAQGGHMAMPVGSHIAIIEDPLRFDGTLPLILVAVSYKGLTFRCACGQPTCTRVGKFKAVWTGVHPHREKTKAMGQEKIE